MSADMHVKYGGVRFVNNVPPREINEYVRSLPPEEKESLFEVIQKLRQEGMITVFDGDVVTIDDEMQDMQEPDLRAGEGQDG